MNSQITSFNIRVYGLLIVDGKVLVTDEFRSGMNMTKFPGGGLEKGEGIADCLRREFEEELDIVIEVNEVFYVNEFFQASAFNSSDQLISFYYKVQTNELDKIPLNLRMAQFKPGDYQSFRWVNFSELDQIEFTFPVDQCVAEKLNG